MARSLSMLLGIPIMVVAAGLLPSRGVQAQGSPTDFSSSDRNGDGAIDMQEYRLRMVEVFYFADANKDGKLTADELRAAQSPDKGAFRAADKNGDGVLVVQEFVEYRLTNFRQADTNGDGKLSSDEVNSWNTGSGASSR